MRNRLWQAACLFCLATVSGHAQPAAQQIAYDAAFTPQDGETLHFADFDLDYRGRAIVETPGIKRKDAVERDYFRVLTPDRSFLSKFDLPRLAGTARSFVVGGKSYVLRYVRQGRDVHPLVRPQAAGKAKDRIP